MNKDHEFEGLRPEEARAIYQAGISPEVDAWFNAFFIENHLDYYTNPDHACTPEQIRFMVYTEGDVRYYPCSDRMFEAIMTRNKSAFIQKKYNEVFQRILGLIDKQIEDKREKEFLESLIIIKFKHETRDEIMLPSRVEKRLLGMFLRRTQIEDPFIMEKNTRYQRVQGALCSEAFLHAIDRAGIADFRDLPGNLSKIKQRADHIEIRRLITLAVEKRLWDSDDFKTYAEEDYHRLFDLPITGNGVERFFELLGIPGNGEPALDKGPKKILWLADESGEVMVDFLIIRYLEKMGHKIIIAFKDGALYTKVDFYDIQEEEILIKALENVYLIQERNLSKNELVSILRSDQKIMAISDGVRENLNLILTTVTFARIFKEVDGVVSRGTDQKRRFFETHFQFTQDIYNISRNEDGGAEIAFKPVHPSVVKFSHKDLENKAGAIISNMKSAKKQGMTVMFYSGIIGSLPGKIEMAKQIMSLFVQYLKEQSVETFIINPSEYFEAGMDADDLMYMWEIVQKSGYIDIWRFQTYEDIAIAFKLMNKKIPPEWVGKDATFSTGCTKEMRIALDVQLKHPEMQIIGPSKEKFMRRSEYGVGKLYDQRLGNICVV